MCGAEVEVSEFKEESQRRAPDVYQQISLLKVMLIRRRQEEVNGKERSCAKYGKPYFEVAL